MPSFPRRGRLPRRLRRLTRPTALLVALLIVAAILPAWRATLHREAGPRLAPAAMGLCGTDGASDGSTGVSDPVPATSAAPTPAVSSVMSTKGTVPEYQEIVSPGETAPHVVSYDGAKLVFKPGAVRTPTGIGVTPLPPGKLSKLDPGMTNVTARPRAGYRFTPHPQTFAEPVEVSLPYDPDQIAPEFTAQDVYTYFYDDVALCWQPLQRVSVDETNHIVTSLTDHFTEMINATVTVPEHPEGTSFNPNQIKGIQAANPATGINLINPPQPNNQGDNRLSYPIEVPTGRLGMQPQLLVGYNSAASNGWLGVGWDLPTPVITVDTRWGVPRYSAGQETETYTLNGEELTPVAHRGPPPARTSEKVFHTRTEGEFARIVRHGDGPKTYTWEVVDRGGVHWHYGALPAASGPAADSTLADGAGNVFLWALREARDPHGNFVRYHYAQVSDPGVDNGAEPGRNLYVQRITWTGSGDTEGSYSATFTRDRDLKEPTRLDKGIDARGGFKRVTADLLRRVDVRIGTDLIRRYEFAYTTGAFDKSLLASITQSDDQGAAVGKHEFGYYDDVRDDAGNYQAFSGAEWSIPGDNLSKGALNLTGDHAGDASAINANSSTGAGGHLYIGVGTSPSKSGSVGVKVGFSHSDDDGVLALVDVDGDSLPDKVFRSGGAVRYRKNLSGPHGQLRFAEQSQPLDLPGIQAERSNSLTLGIEGYLGAVAAQLDYVDTTATTSQYFTDVNGDGISDLVTGSTVLFGRIGANGSPVYGVSSDTPVPVRAGTVDATGLLPDTATDRDRMIDSYPLLDTLRRWTAPFDGTVRIEGTVALSPETADTRAASTTADGVRVAVQREDTELWAQQIGAHDNGAYTPGNVDTVTVSRGDRLYFRVQSLADGALDEVSWDPRITYLDVPADATDVNGLAIHRYQASRDFTLGGRAAEVKVPVTGTMHLSGEFTKKAATTDDVTVRITRDGTPVLEKTLAAATAGNVPVDLDIPVTKDQVLRWQVGIDSPVDLDALSWTPRAYYTAAEGMPRVTDDVGNPLIDVYPPYSVDMYPVDRLTAPQQLHHVAGDGQLTVTPTLAFDFGGATPTSQLVFTVKRRGELLGKRVIDVTQGQVAAVPPLTVAAQAGDDLAFDFSTRDTTLAGYLTSAGADVDGVTEQAGVHSAAVEGAFPQPYRGWAAIGYNGNRDRAGQPVHQADLVIDEHFGDQLPDSVDPQAQKDAFSADPRVDPPKVAPFSPSPRDQRWGSGAHSYVTRTKASSSRLGVASIDLPEPADFTGVAVPRVSRSRQVSVTGSVGGGIGSVGGSVATGDSSGELDFIDMNGDHFPDVVGSGGIQYTDPTGGLGATRGSLPDGAVRRSGTTSGNASAGSAARTITTGRGQAAPSGTTTANAADAGNDMPPLGVGGSMGTSSSDTRFDLLDVNGDDLPDRVYSDGRVALNLGYRFGAAEAWRNPAALNDGHGSDSGLNIGFNTDFYGFAGGASFSQGSTGTNATMADMNGDGLLDRVYAGTPLRVGINTGNGFQPPVPFNGSLSGLTSDRNAKLGGGAYFTFSICFIAICIIINPGADISTGASRSEQMLRDINGDGYVDQLASTSDNQLTVVQNRTGRTNLLRSVNRPLGATMEFDYSRDGNTYDQPQSRWVLSRVAVNDGHAGDGQDVQVSTYEYSGGVFNRLEREFYGYATVTRKVRDAGNSGAVYRNVTREYRTDSHYTRGLLTREVTSDATGHRYLETVNTYTPRDVGNPAGAADLSSTSATLFMQLTRTDRRFFEGQSDAGKATYTTMEYDRFGNLTRSFDAGEPGTGDDLDTRIGYSGDDPACQASHITGTPNRIDVSGGGAAMRHRESTVDCGTGEVTQVRARLDAGNEAVTDLAYFGNGNLKSVTDPPNLAGQRFRLEYAYDTTVGQYVTSVIDSFGYRSTSTYNLKFGQVETSTDVNNQAIRTSYDSVGRPDTVVGPYEAVDNKVTIDFDYHPEAATPYALTRHLDREADGSVRADTIDTIIFVDGLGRVIQTKKDAAVAAGPDTPAANVMIVSGHTDYDFAGRAVREYFPVTEPKGAANTTFDSTVDTVAPTVRSYDVLDRVTGTVLPDTTRTSSSYGFGPDRAGTTQFETAATDANGHTTRTYRDVREQITAVKQANPTAGQPQIWTSYAYDPLGQLLTVTDDHGNVTTSGYDNLGRRTTVTSPDSGRTETVYDLAGNSVKKITAKLAAQSQAVEYDYDYNRLARIRYPIFPANNVTYTYGAPGAANNGADRVIGVVDGAGTVSREYGPLGEITKETRTSSAQGSHVYTFVTQYRYDSWNRVRSLTFPDGEVLTYHYDSGGQADAATGSKGEYTYPYLKQLTYDKFEQRILLVTGNGTRTTYAYGDADRRVATIKASLAQGYVFENLNYTYDNVGNVTSLRNDTVAPSSPDVGMQVGGPSSQTFRYDDLNQLVHAEGSYQPRTPQTDTYRVDTTYDTIGNIINKAQVHQSVSNGNTITDGKLSYTYAYAYTSAKPHAPTSVGIYTNQYDANGNKVSQDQQPKPRQQLIWDEENRLACSHANVQSQTLPQTPASCDNAGGTANDARYYYDDQGNRVIKDSAQFHIYPNQNYSTRGNASFKHIYVGDTRLLTKTVEPPNRIEDRQYYAHGDHLGSTGFVTDSHGQLAEHLQYLPGGETWVSEHPSQPLPQQYTGKELDPETNLYYYGARYYDPRTQIWQSPDPALDSYLDGKPNGGVHHPSNLALYTYAANNPVAYTDPNGLWGIVGHQLTPQAAALAVGFSPQAAAAIGRAAWAPDTDARSATAGGSIIGAMFLSNSDQRVIHLLTGGNAAATQATARQRFQRVVNTMSLSNPTFTEEQENILHGFGDSFAHVDLSTAGRQGCPCMYEAPTGHAGDGHRPDNPDTNRGQYRQYLEGLYDVLASRAQRERLTPRMSRTDFVNTMMHDVAGVTGEPQQRAAAQNIIRRMEAQAP
ncbi:SpvB/TcaC N-terminal domain-containing protein [Micromonospora sp. NPDC048930]|uniref:SpvB/TcaC N-terminal domain-containing protein n=1 Tax=Micromonospora sp. NPDC048930 TaxID=3364261 RepID=UPI00371F2D14